MAPSGTPIAIYVGGSNVHERKVEGNAGAFYDFRQGSATIVGMSGAAMIGNSKAVRERIKRFDVAFSPISLSILLALSGFSPAGVFIEDNAARMCAGISIGSLFLGFYFCISTGWGLSGDAHFFLHFGRFDRDRFGRFVPEDQEGCRDSFQRRHGVSLKSTFSTRNAQRRPTCYVRDLLDWCALPSHADSKVEGLTRCGSKDDGCSCADQVSILIQDPFEGLEGREADGVAALLKGPSRFGGVTAICSARERP
ncbi:MAG: hypothetical protein JTT11_08485 [Candidatus Brockarchaeota archaeon]|nr:hypothetical protein [Candidatus Brockarchaeota archaeon]